MDDPPSEGNERVSDIFIVSTDETVAVLLKEHLEQNEHQVTVFTDDTQLTETLHARKPDLLIFDGTTGEGYEIIRRIKASDDLWVVPVLILSSASTMEDFLRVLEMNADNFIAPPYDSPDHLSLIEGMLTTPVERQTPEEIKKQFRVRQDDHTYVIAATSRKLLEYLLSSFEILVGKSSELSSVTSKLEKISESARELEQTVTGQTRDIEVLTATVLEKEQKRIELSRECEELKEALTQKTDETKKLLEESDNKKTSLDTMENALIEEETLNASLEKTIRDLKSELGQQKNVFAAGKTRLLEAEQEINAIKQAKEQLEHDLNQVIAGKNQVNETLKEDAQQQEQKIADLTREYEELGKTLSQKTDEIKNLAAQSVIQKTSLETLQNKLKEEETRSAYLEKTLRDLTSEFELQQSALVAEKNLSVLAEHGINTLGQEKTQAEREMNQIIIGLNESVQHYAGELTAVKNELEAETKRRVLAETLAGEHQREFEQSQDTLRSDMEALNRQAGNLQEALAVSAAALETERELRKVSEEKTKTAVRQQEDLGKKTLRTNEKLERANKDQAEIISQVKEELKTSRNQVQSLEADVSDLTQAKSQAQVDVRTLTAELERTRTTLANERKDHLELHEGHAAAAKERHLVQQSLFSSDEENSPKENLDLIVLEELHLPVSVPQVSLPGTANNTPGLHQPPGSKKDPASAESLGETPRIFSGVIPRVSGISDADSLFLEPEPFAKNADTAPGTTKVNRPAKEQKIPEYPPEKSSLVNDEEVNQSSRVDTKHEKKIAEGSGSSGNEAGSRRQSGETQGAAGAVPGGDISLTRSQWLDLLKWARHSEAMSEDERLKIVRMGRLVQKDGKLGKKQQGQVREILSSAYARGYQSQY
ncbi:MAG: response regulator [Methanomicrobiales archaeon]